MENIISSTRLLIFSDKKGDFLARARDNESKRASGFLHEIEKSGDIREALKRFNEN